MAAYQGRDRMMSPQTLETTHQREMVRLHELWQRDKAELAEARAELVQLRAELEAQQAQQAAGPDTLPPPPPPRRKPVARRSVGGRGPAFGSS